MPWPLIAAAGIGAAATVWGGERANRQSRQEAKRNRRFQERMSNTQWQRGVADMEAAGLNPALAYQQGGASSPSGSLAQQSNIIPDDSVGNAMSVRKQGAEMKQINANIKIAEAQARKTGSEADWAEANNAAWGFSRRKDGSLHMDMSMPHLFTKVQQELRSGAAQANLAEMSMSGARNVRDAARTPYLGRGAAYLQMLRGMGPSINLGVSRSYRPGGN